MSPGPEDDISQAEKRAVLRQDEDVRHRSRNGDTGTYLSHTHDDTLGGRFAAIGAPMVTGRDAMINYPAAAAHQRDPCGPEPPLGYCIDAMSGQETSAASIFPVEATGGADGAPSSLPGVERAAPPSSLTNGDPAAPGEFTQHIPASGPHAGSSPTNKDEDQ